MENFKWRVRISVLWLFMAVAWAGYAIVDLVRPGAIEEIMAGEVAGMQISSRVLMYFALVCWLIPLTMAFLSLILTDSPTHWANTILGVVLGLLGIVGVLDGALARQLPAALSLMEGAMIVVAALIVWHGWKLPVNEQ